MIMMAMAPGCSEDPDMPAPKDEMPGELEDYYFIIGDDPDSRSVDYTDDNHSEFTGGEMLGCFALDASGNVVAGAKSNACYTVSVIKSDNEAVNGKRVLVPQSSGDKLDKGYAKYLFYYPYDMDVRSLDDLKNYTHTVRETQSEKEDYEASDLLWDVAVPAERYCTVEMDHAMANIIIVIDGVEYDVQKGAVVLGQPLTASAVNLTAPDIESMRNASGDYYYNVNASQPLKDIQAYFANYSSANDRFRAAVPANRTLNAGTKIIKLWSKTDGREKTFTLRNDVKLEPGKNYYFTLIKKGHTNPSDIDEESWVLDVLDPETGEPVGLLCREYVLFQPGSGAGDQHPTGQYGTNASDNTQTKWIDSQAWVFYNLIEGDRNKRPDLTTGCILRFIYDVRINAKDVYYDGGLHHGTEGCYWPAPHKFQGQGIVLVPHEHCWRNGVVSTDFNEVFVGADKEVPYYMHGGRIYWSGANNKIVYFDMPKNADGTPLQITTQDAYDYGHIAIPETGRPYVSYDSFTGSRDVKGCKVGFIMPHCLIDNRYDNENGKLEYHKYPLVKIGFNQFWMSQSLRARTLIDGTPLRNYCPPVVNGKFQFEGSGNASTYAPGFCYPGRDDVPNSKFVFNPFANFSEEELEQIKMSVLYNFTAVETGLMVPPSVEGKSTYHMPTYTDFHRVLTYLGFAGFQKIMTGNHQTRNGDKPMEGASDYDSRDALREGKILYTNAIESYTPNVSGLNLRADGFLRFSYSGVGFYNVGVQIGLMLESEDLSIGRQILSASPWNTWTAQNDQLFNDGFNDGNTRYILHKNSGEPSDAFASHSFLPIRFYLKYELTDMYYTKYDDTFSPYNSRSQRGMSEAQSAPHNSAGDVYVAMEPLP